YDVQISAWCDTKEQADDTWYSEFEVVEAGDPAEFVLNGWSVSPSTAEADETVTIEGEVENIGGEENSSYIDLYVGDMENWKDFEEVTLPAGDTQTVSFTGVPESDWSISDPGIYDVRVEPYDWPENAWESELEIVAPGGAYFDVYGVQADDTAEGQNVEVTATIENTGQQSGTQTVEMTSDLGSDSTSITLNAGNSTTETFTTGTSKGDAGSYTATVSSANESDSDTFEVLTPHNFTVYGVNAKDAVEGQNVEVTATIENTGGASDTQTVEMSSGVGSDSTSITLNGGESTTETFTTGTSTGDAGSYTATVSSADDSDSDNFKVIEDTEDPHFSVASVEAKDVVEGDDVVVDATIENIGGQSDTQTVEMSSGVGSDSTSITLNAGESTTETFTTGTSTGDAGSYTATVSSADSSAEDDFVVKEPAYFSVEITGHDDEIVEGAETVVEYRVTNTGDVKGAQDIEFYVDGSHTDTERNVDLQAGEASTLEFTWRTEEGDVDDHDLTVKSEDEEDGVTVTVVQGAFFEVNILDYDEIVSKGDEVLVEYRVRNVGSEEGAQDINFSVQDEADDLVFEDSEFVMLNGGETHEGEFRWQTEDVGEYEMEVASEDESKKMKAAVEEGSIFVVEIIDHDDNVTQGEEVVVEYGVTNDGDEADEQTIEFMVDGESKDSTSVRLDAGKEHHGEFTWQAEGAGEHEIVVASEDHEDETVVTVVDEGTFTVEILDHDDGVAEGDEIVVGYRARNEGGEEATQEIELRVDGEIKDSEEITLAGGRAYESDLSWETGEGDAGEHELVVASDDDQEQVTVNVAKGPYFEVEIISPEEEQEFEEYGEVIVEYTVTNAGDENGTQTIELVVDGEVEDSEEVTLDVGESYEGELVWLVEEGGEHTIAVNSENYEDTVTCGVLKEAEFKVEIVDHDEEAVDGEDVVIEYRVTNEGDLDGTQTVEFSVDGEVEDSVEMDLTGGKSDTDHFLWTPEGPGEYVLKVSTEDDSQEMVLTVLKAPEFDVELLDLDEQVSEGEELVVEYRLTNVGDVEDTREVEFVVQDEDGKTVFEDSEEVTLGPEESFESEFSWETEEPGDYTVVLAGESQEVTVEDSGALGGWCGLWWLILIVIILIAIVLVVLIWRNNKDEGYPTSSYFSLPFLEKDEEEEEETGYLRTLQTMDKEDRKMDTRGKAPGRARTSRFVEDESFSEESFEEDNAGGEAFVGPAEREEDTPTVEEDEEADEIDEEVSEAEEDVMECPTCGNEVSTDSETCYACGEDLSAQREQQEKEPDIEESREDISESEEDMFIECENCGFLVMEDEDECPYCDNPL
ncbi:MAG: CARDB domain-containing protein, partial [Candidatus Aenigmatarchaeota archaeon]